MSKVVAWIAPFVAIGCMFGFAGAASATVLDDIGVTALRQLDPTLIGTGIAVIQAEADYGAVGAYETNPSYVGQPVAKFSYANFGVSYAFGTFPNSAGTVSAHANIVGYYFYGTVAGVAPGVSSVDNYSADSYIDKVVVKNRQPTYYDSRLHNARVINQSFTASSSPSNPSEDAWLEQMYDNYADVRNVLFISGIGNGTPTHPGPPSSCYNGIGVACINIANGTVGPTSDGRSKPDITAPGGNTSYSTPYVSGAAAVLMQAAARGDGGTGTAAIEAAGDIRTIKALLLNGATKPTGWTHTATQPLDVHYGAGQLNVLNSYLNLHAGVQAASSTALVPSGASLMPSSASNVRATSGWDNAYLTSSSTHDAVNNYFVVPAQQSGVTYTLTATLVWNRQQGEAEINNLDLYLYDITTQSLISNSVSTVDNVEHIYTSWLRPGDTYGIQVWKQGSPNSVSDLDLYSIVYSFTPVALPSLAGDANGDNTVNSTDLGLLLANYNQTIPNGTNGWALGDFNIDGTVNSTDLGVLLAHYNQASPATSAVPEPSGLFLAAVGVIGMIAIAWRRRT